MTQALAFSATFGVNPGYDRHPAERPNPEKSVAAAWHAAMERERSSSGIQVGAVLTLARVVYPAEYGCPPAGELAVTATGQSNPAFCADTTAYGLAVARVCEGVRQALKQETVLVSMWPVSATIYLRAFR